jgi:hypothetical protein
MGSWNNLGVQVWGQGHGQPRGFGTGTLGHLGPEPHRGEVDSIGLVVLRWTPVLGG